MLKKLYSLILSIGIIGNLTSCACMIGSSYKAEEKEITLEQRYEKAVNDATVAEASEIFNNLTPITESNPKLIWSNINGEKMLLVSTWTRYPQSYKVNETISLSWGETWVTVVPELKDFIKNNPKQPQEMVLRIEQLLGLPMNSGYKGFVEMWVMPGDLFRPSPDNEITDTKADLDFPQAVDENYKQWFNNNIINAYFTTGKKMPWTRLGYTYDWGNPSSEIGLSEFVIKKDSKVVVKSVTDTPDYLKQ